MRVEVWSDVVCPWCYIGLERFRAALARLDDAADVELVLRPFQLDPSAPREPSSVLDVYARKFGGPDNAFRMVEQVTEVAAGEGLTFHLDRALRANTFDAHRLGVLAERRGLGPALHERLMQAYFTEGLDVADHHVLVRLAADVGVDPEEARGWLASGAGADEVRHGIAEAADLGITAVPTYVVDRRFLVPGAQDPDTFVAVLERARAEAAPG